MKKLICITICAITALGWALSVEASGPGTSAGIILKQNSCPRAEAMGEAHTAISDTEAGAASWNPAGLYNAYRQDVSAMYFRGIIDDAFGSLSYSQTFTQKYSLGGSLLFYDAGLFDLTGFDGQTSRIAAERDFLGILTGAGKLKIWEREFLVGTNVKFLYSSLLESEAAFAVALDLGAMYEVRELMDDLVAGITIKNLGTPMKYIDKADPLPLMLLLGASYKLLKGKVHDLILAADGHLDLEGNIRGNLGAEYWHGKIVALRAGYKLGYDLDSLTIGAGFRYLNLQMDYSFGMMSALNSIHKVSLTYTLAVDVKRQVEVLGAKPKVRSKRRAKAKPLLPVMAEVLEIENIGGEARRVVLSVGKNKKLRKGHQGTIFNNSGLEIAKIKIIEVYPTRCLAKVIEKSGEIGKKTKVEIQREKKEEKK